MSSQIVMSKRTPAPSKTSYNILESPYFFSSNTHHDNWGAQSCGNYQQAYHHVLEQQHCRLFPFSMWGNPTREVIPEQSGIHSSRAVMLWSRKLRLYEQGCQQNPTEYISGNVSMSHTDVLGALHPVRIFLTLPLRSPTVGFI